MLYISEPPRLEIYNLGGLVSREIYACLTDLNDVATARAAMQGDRGSIHPHVQPVPAAEGAEEIDR